MPRTGPQKWVVFGPVGLSQKRLKAPPACLEAMMLTTQNHTRKKKVPSLAAY